MSAPVDHTRRRLLQTGLALGALGLAGWGSAAVLKNRVANPCLASLPRALAEHPLVASAWQGLDPAQLWDVHAHLAGTGDSDSGIRMSPRMGSPLHPVDYVQRLAYLNAGCAATDDDSVDHAYVARLSELADGMASGAKLLLFAFDQSYDRHGRARPGQTAFQVPDAYARRVALTFPERFEWVASIHPWRADALAALEQAAAEGARAVKWLPPAQGIDPADPACDPFYAALARLDLPLICHGGEERAVRGANQPEFGNPLRLRRALDAGVRVVVAHCASEGRARDLDRGPDGPLRPAFALFSRMLDEPRYAGRLFGDVSALCLANRDPAVIRQVLARRDWHPRLLYGSDYPLPGVMPLIAPGRLARQGLLAADAVAPLEAIRRHNPLLFHFVLLRQLAADGQGFAPEVFATRPFFARQPS